MQARTIIRRDGLAHPVPRFSLSRRCCPKQFSAAAIATLVLATSWPFGVQNLQAQNRSQRVNPRAIQQSQETVLQGESLVQAAKPSEGKVANQDMQPFGNQWQGNGQLFWGPTQAGSRLELTIRVLSAGNYELSGYFTKAPDYGIVQIGMAGRKLAEFDGLDPRGVSASGRVGLGTIELTAGDQTLILVVAGKHARSKGFLVGLDAIALKPLTSQANAIAATPKKAVETKPMDLAPSDAIADRINPNMIQQRPRPEKTPTRGEGNNALQRRPLSPAELRGLNPQPEPPSLADSLKMLNADLTTLSNREGWTKYLQLGEMNQLSDQLPSNWNTQQWESVQTVLGRLDQLRDDPLRATFLARPTVAAFHELLRASADERTIFRPPIVDGRFHYPGPVIPIWDRVAATSKNDSSIRYRPIQIPPELEIWNGGTGEFKFFGLQQFVSQSLTDLNWEFRWRRPPPRTASVVWQVWRTKPSPRGDWQTPADLIASGAGTPFRTGADYASFHINFNGLVDRPAASVWSRVQGENQSRNLSSAKASARNPNPEVNSTKQIELNPESNANPPAASGQATKSIEIGKLYPAVQPSLLFHAKLASRMTQVFFIRIVCLGSNGKIVGGPSNVVEFRFGPELQNDIEILPPEPFDPEAHRDPLAPVVTILEYAPIRYQADDAHLRWVVTLDSPLLNLRKGQKLKLKPKDDDLLDDIVGAIGDVVSFFEDAINWVSEAYEDIKAAAISAIADDLLNCGDPCRIALSAGLTYGLAALGVPPEIPNFDEFVDMGKVNIAEMIAAEARAAGIPITDEMAKELVDEVARKAAETSDRGSGGDQFIKPDPDFQYRPAYVRIRVVNPIEAGARDAGLSLHAWEVYRFEYIPIPNLKAGETRELTVGLRADFEYWDTKHIREHGGTAWDSSARRQGWFDKYHSGTMSMAVQVTALPVGQWNVLQRPPAYGSTGYGGIDQSAAQSFLGSQP